MSSGTILNDVYAIRIHRSNADDVRVDAKRMLEYYRDRLLIMAAMSPMNINTGDGEKTWDHFVRREIDGMWDEIRQEHWREWCANYIIEQPGDVVDDYDIEEKDEIVHGKTSSGKSQ